MDQGEKISGATSELTLTQESGSGVENYKTHLLTFDTLSQNLR